MNRVLLAVAFLAVGRPVQADQPITNSVGIVLTLIPAGSFFMGGTKDRSRANDGRMGSLLDGKPHRVTISKAFYLGTHEVTNHQWKQVMGHTPSKYKEDDLPVENITREEGIKYCNQLSDMPEERKLGRVYRLPTEAEWEYACRAGGGADYSFGNDDSRLVEFGWFSRNSGGKTHPGGLKRPNSWGLYDVHGNVQEICSDWYGEYSGKATTDPTGPVGGSFGMASATVCRGGAYNSQQNECRASFRRSTESRDYTVGLRVVMTLSR